MPIGVKLQQSRRRTRTYDRQPGNLAEVLEATEEAIDGKADADHDHVADDISDAGDTGRDLLRAADPAAGRAVLDVESAAQLDARDVANRDRTNHTGTQLATTISDLGDFVSGTTSYTHEQVSPSTTWTINHGLSFRPTVSVTDTSGDECEGEVTHPTGGQTVIVFSAAFAGTARLT